MKPVCDGLLRGLALIDMATRASRRVARFSGRVGRAILLRTIRHA